MPAVALFKAGKKCRKNDFDEEILKKKKKMDSGLTASATIAVTATPAANENKSP